MPLKNYLFAGLCLSALSLKLCSTAGAIELKDEPKLQAIADQLIDDEHYTQAELELVFQKAVVQQSVLDAMMNPAEYKFTWGKYRKLFLKEDRILQGVAFWNQYQDELDRAEQEYGVPASVIVAIIGVESKYGRFKGSHKVLDSLVSLTVGFPRRSKFFASELKQYLVLTKENDLAFDQILGSYAGAMGFPQFISSSYRAYAIDFSGDGKTDLINQPVDAIGSVANYFIENGWRPGEPVTSLAHEEVSESIADLANRKRKTQFTAAVLRQNGALLAESIGADEKLNVLMLDASEIVSEPRNSNTYIVRAGDTVCQIAEKLKISCKALLSANSLGSEGRIFRGQRLKLPKGSSTTTLSPSKKTSSSGKWAVTEGSEKGSDKSLAVDTVQERYFYTHRNFYAITEYNHSVLYAMAVHELSKAIDSEKAKAIQVKESTTEVEKSATAVETERDVVELL